VHSSESTTVDPRVPDDELCVRAARDEEVYVIALYGELDLATVADLQRELDRAEASDAGEIVVDLSALHFVDSTGIRALVEAHGRDAGARLRLLRGADHVHRAFEMCGLQDHLPFDD
jgi:anti-sigma B factor antagonist